MRLPILPATHSLGQISAHTLVLELHSYNRKDVDQALAGTSTPRAAQILAHELTHWYDIVGTVWGQAYLDTLFHAYDQVLTKPLPSTAAYAPALALFDTDRNILFPSYYKFAIEGSPRRDGPGTWKMQVTTGVRFNSHGVPDEDDPFFFVRFYEHGREVARQPITDGVLMEMRAVAAEVRTYSDLRGKMKDEERIIADALFSKKSIGDTYDPQLTTYSAGAHLLSKAVPGQDVATALTIGSGLAGLAFDLTSPLFQRLVIPPELAGPPRRMRGFRDRANRGFVFACLCYHFRTVARDGSAAENDVLEALLRATGLPPADTIRRRAREFTERRRPQELIHPELRRIRANLQAAGLAIHDWRAAHRAGEGFADWAKLPAPVVLDCEFAVFQVGQQTLSSADADFLNECHYATDAITRQALRASRGFDFHFTDFVY